MRWDKEFDTALEGNVDEWATAEHLAEHEEREYIPGESLRLPAAADRESWIRPPADIS